MILIADDDEVFADILSLRLEKNGYETMVVLEGVDVIPTIQREKVDLIILDLKIPNKPGIHILSYLKSDPAKKDIPVIVMTGSYPDLKDQVLKMGAAAFFLKPYDADTLLRTIGKLVSGAVRTEV